MDILIVLLSLSGIKLGKNGNGEGENSLAITVEDTGLIGLWFFSCM